MTCDPNRRICPWKALPFNLSPHAFPFWLTLHLLRLVRRHTKSTSRSILEVELEDSNHLIRGSSTSLCHTVGSGVVRSAVLDHPVALLAQRGCGRMVRPGGAGLLLWGSRRVWPTAAALQVLALGWGSGGGGPRLLGGAQRLAAAATT